MPSSPGSERPIGPADPVVAAHNEWPRRLGENLAFGSALCSDEILDVDKTAMFVTALQTTLTELATDFEAEFFRALAETSTPRVDRGP